MTWYVALCDICEDDAEVVGVSMSADAARRYALRHAWEVAATGGGVPWSRNNYVHCDGSGWPRGRHLSWRVASWVQS